MNTDLFHSSSFTLLSMKLHPLTHIILAIEMALVVVILPDITGVIVLIGVFCASLLLPSRTEVNLARPFLKVLAVAAFFLFVIHAVKWRPLGISVEGLYVGLEGFIHIGIPFACVIYLSRRITSEELFALLIDLKTPPPVILILFRTLWLVPRLMERMGEVVTAQKLRGMQIDNTFRRAGAVIPTLSPIFTSMIDEISENSLTLTTRGFLRHGRKTHLLTLTYNWMDAAFLSAATVVLIVLWF